MLFVVVAYFLLQTNKYTISSLPYQVLNLVGAILLFISLCVHFNLGSFIIEVFWILITLYGMAKNLKRKKSEA
ncbi:CBU_0592 family membrane protein [Halarcobacter sp.]